MCPGQRLHRQTESDLGDRKAWNVSHWYTKGMLTVGPGSRPSPPYIELKSQVQLESENPEGFFYREEQEGASSIIPSPVWTTKVSFLVFAVFYQCLECLSASGHSHGTHPAGCVTHCSANLTIKLNIPISYSVAQRNVINQSALRTLQNQTTGRRRAPSAPSVTTLDLNHAHTCTMLWVPKPAEAAWTQKSLPSRACTPRGAQ